MKPADGIWLALISAGLVADVLLLRRNKALLTHRARTRGGWVMQAVLFGHFTGLSPKWADPFSLIYMFNNDS